MAGGAFRLLGTETLAKEERRDGVPFLILIMAVIGAIVEWFNPNDPVAIALDAYTFGGAFGRLAFALPVILLVLAVWLFRHPSSVNDNGRIGIGAGVLIVCISALCHIYGGQPAWGDPITDFARAGGIVGFGIGMPLATYLSIWVAVPLIVLSLILSLFIITKTPPNRIGARLRELYAYLFGAELPDPEELAAKKAAKGDTAVLTTIDDLPVDDDSVPWWRRNKTRREDDPAFDSPVLLGSRTDVVDRTPKDDFGIELIEDLLKAENAVKRFTGEVDAAPATGIRDDSVHDGQGGGAAAGVAHLPGVAVTASEKGRAGEFDDAAPEPPTAPYRLPAASVLEPGTPAKTRSGANDEIVRAITEVLALERSTSPSETISRSVFGISTPIALLPGMGERMRTSLLATA
jgi:S-DNA-T family DNA segregation ATPase FtsK/SpoIIIE